MSRQLLTLTVALAFFQASVADDVTVDVSKLTAFTTTVTFDGKSLMTGMQQTGGFPNPQARRIISDMAKGDLLVQSKLIANIPGELMKIKVDLTGHSSVGPPISGKETYILTFDGPTGYVAYEGSVSGDSPFGKLEAQGCAKFKFDTNLIPPPEAIKQQIDQQAPMAAMMANQMPHAVKGDLAYYTDRDTLLALHVSDGTPAAIWLLGQVESDPEQAAELVQGVPPAIKFGDFTEAEPFSEVQCATADSTTMLDNPRAEMALFLGEQLLKRLQLAKPIAPVTHHVFAQFPQVVRNPDAGKPCMLPVEATTQTAIPVEPLGFVGFAAVCMVSAAVGAGIAVSAARRAFSKPEAVYMEIS